MEEIRLNKYLSEAGVCSRREADRLIEAGRVRIDGVIAVMGQKVSEGQEVYLDDKKVLLTSSFALLAVNKPKGIVCTTDKRWNDATLEELVHYSERVFSIGRLDKDSEGLILMTNQGDLLNKIMKAGNYHEKEYVVSVDKKIDDSFLSKMSKGVWLEELKQKTRPCKIWKSGDSEFHIILTQGLNRQIRRMTECFGYHVRSLKRIRIMNICLGDLKSGEYREVTSVELQQLNILLADSTSNPEHTGYRVRHE